MSLCILQPKTSENLGVPSFFVSQLTSRCTCHYKRTINDVCITSTHLLNDIIFVPCLLSGLPLVQKPKGFQAAWEWLCDRLERTDTALSCSSCKTHFSSVISSGFPYLLLLLWGSVSAGTQCAALLPSSVFARHPHLSIIRHLVRRPERKIAKQITVQQVFSTSRTHCRIYYFQRAL